MVCLILQERRIAGGGNGISSEAIVLEDFVRALLAERSPTGNRSFGYGDARLVFAPVGEDERLTLESFRMLRDLLD